MTPSPFLELKPGDVLPLRASADGPEDAAHQWSAEEIDALILAQAARRPLLVRGEPGTGKTQLARAAAQHLGWKLLPETIHPRYEPQDLLWRMDAVRRLADAQTPNALKQDVEYFEPGPLWQAFDWPSAHRYGTCRQVSVPPKGHVILLDEIDKADSDLPNSLLEVLGQRSFSIAPLGLKIPEVARELPAAERPLVIITTNEERELPAAFLRRCVVLNLAPSATQTYADWLVQRGLAHHGPMQGRAAARLIDRRVLQAAADQLVADRDQAVRAGLPPPGPAEYLDLLGALLEVAGVDVQAQLQWLDRLSRYAFVKNAAGDDSLPRQSRLPQVRAEGQSPAPPVGDTA